jgi:hypothetical protein
VNFIQWSMVAYPVFRPQSMLSATVVMVLGSVLLVLGFVEILVDMVDRERPCLREPEATSQEEHQGTYS